MVLQAAMQNRIVHVVCNAAAVVNVEQISVHSKRISGTVIHGVTTLMLFHLQGECCVVMRLVICTKWDVVTSLLCIVRTKLLQMYGLVL